MNKKAENDNYPIGAGDVEIARALAGEGRESLGLKWLREARIALARNVDGGLDVSEPAPLPRWKKVAGVATAAIFVSLPIVAGVKKAFFDSSDAGEAYRTEIVADPEVQSPAEDFIP